MKLSFVFYSLSRLINESPSIVTVYILGIFFFTNTWRINDFPEFLFPKTEIINTNLSFSTIFSFLFFF